MNSLGVAPKPDPTVIRVSAEEQVLISYRDLALLRSQRGNWFWIGVIAPWVVPACFWFFALKSSQEHAVQVQSLAQAKYFSAVASTLSEQNKQFCTMAKSVEGLSKAVVSTSARTNGLETRLERLQSDVRRLESKLLAEEMSDGMRRPERR